MKQIGNTPLIKLERLSEPRCAEIYVKYEGGNPTGRMKDRMPLSTIECVEWSGYLEERHPEQTCGRRFRGQEFLEQEKELSQLSSIQD